MAVQLITPPPKRGKVWHSNTDKILKVKYMGKNATLCAKVAINSWANRMPIAIWLTELQIYAHGIYLTLRIFSVSEFHGFALVHLFFSVGN